MVLLSRNTDFDGVVAGGAGGVRRGFGRRLGLPRAVGSADLEGVLAGLGVSTSTSGTPSIQGKLFCEVGLVPGRAPVGRDLDALDAAVGCPGDATDRGLAGGDLGVVLHGVDAGLGLDRALLGPGALNPVGVEVPVGKLYLAEPLGRRDVPVEAGYDEADRVAVLEWELATVQAEGDQRLASVER